MDNQIKIDLMTNTVSIVVTRKNGTRHTSEVNLDSYNLLLKEKHFWVHETRHKSKKFYLVYGGTNGKIMFVHRLIMKQYLTLENPEVDHINPSRTLCNLRSNLRVTGRSGQMRNTVANHGKHTLPTVPKKHWLDCVAKGGLRADQVIRIRAWGTATQMLASGKVEATREELLDLQAMLAEFHDSLPHHIAQQ